MRSTFKILFYLKKNNPKPDRTVPVMGNTEQEQAEAMKRYIREIVIPEYAKNFNKGLSAEDIIFYGKIHFDRNRSDNELNMHCHLIVSRKDQSKKKLSPLTNHKNTKKGAIKGGYDRTNLFRQAEQRFDKLFGYNRPLSESFEYYNTMKDGTIADQLNIQEQQISDERKMKECSQVGMNADIQTSKSENMLENKQESNLSNSNDRKQNSNTTNLGLSSVLGLLAPDSNKEEEQIPMKRK